MKNLIFIGGIHGSGKGIICDEIIKSSNLIHLTASQILKWEELSSQENKEVQNINETQDRLVKNLQSIISNNQRYLLDGHYSLLNKTGVPEKVPLSTFESISPSKLILVVANPEIIVERLKKRDLKNYSTEYISKFQELEIEYAKEIEQYLKIPLLTINSISFKYDDIKKFIQ